MAYGDKRDFPKIDIFVDFGKGNGGLRYLASTTWARTCKEARERYAAANGYDAGSAAKLRAFYDKGACR